LKPAYLKEGDCIGITASARKISKEEINHSIKIFESWGLKTKLAKGIFEEENQFAGSDSTRANAFQQLLDDDSVKAIICARGGYGTVRIVDRLDFSNFVKKPKWICGYSDVTVLHSHINRNFNISTIHSCIPLNMLPEKINNESVNSLRRLLFGQENKVEIPYHQLNKNIKNTDGVLIGGNLSVLISLLGSKSDINTEGKILFIEDLDEYLYHIDRMMMAMKRAGKLENLKALIVGGMSEMRDNTIPFGKDAYQIISECVAEYSYPVIFDLPAGHQALNLALKLGSETRISISDQRILITQEA